MSDLPDLPVPSELQQQLVSVGRRLAQGDFDALVREGIFHRVSAAELRDAVDAERYWATLAEPPDDAYADATMSPLDDGSGWFLAVPVWTVEHGASDLSLVAEFVKTDDDMRLLVSDVHVL